jgi:hypothetical protein
LVSKVVVLRSRKPLRWGSSNGGSSLMKGLILLLQEWISYHKSSLLAGCMWLTPVILGAQEAEIRRTKVQSQSRQRVREILSWKRPAQKRAGEWLKVKTLSSSPRTTKKEKERAVCYKANLPSSPHSVAPSPTMWSLFCSHSLSHFTQPPGDCPRSWANASTSRRF